MNTINQKPELSIEAFKIKNFKGIRELELKNLPTNAPWIFITGENGFGKTSVLQAIASVMAGEERHKFEYFQAQKGKVGIQVKLHAFDSFYGVFPTEGGKNNSWEHFPEMMFNNENGSLLACYGPSRLDTYTQCSSKEKPGITESLYDSSSLLINIEYQIHTLTPNLILDSPIFGYSEIFLWNYQSDTLNTAKSRTESAFESELIKAMSRGLSVEKRNELEDLLNKG